MELLDLGFLEELGQIVVIHSILLVVFQIGQMDRQLLCLVAAVMPSAAEADRGVPAFVDFAVLIGQGNIEQPTVVSGQLCDFGEGIALMAQHFVPGFHQSVIELI